MTIDVSTALAQPAPQLHAGYGVSLTDLSAFNDALRVAQQRGGQGTLSPQPVGNSKAAVEAVFRPLEYINDEAVQLHGAANAAVAAGSQMTPGEIVQLTVRCHEFLFHCQLTSNIANRASDGLQQLFRQQS